jgi:hypothetical protein
MVMHIKGRKMQLGLTVMATALAIGAMHFAAYGLLFRRWAANVWFAVLEHSAVGGLSLGVGMLTIFLVSVRSPSVAKITAVLTVFCIVMCELLFSQILSPDWAFIPTVNHMTGALLALLLALAYQLLTPDQRSTVNTEPAMNRRVTLSLVAASFVLAVGFRSLRGDWIEGLSFNLSGTSDRLYALFAIVVPLTVIILWVSDYHRARRFSLRSLRDLD